jgi:hypothetical protein
MSFHEGDPYMSNSETDSQLAVKEIARNRLGSNNLGYFGPKSETEAKIADSYADEKYTGPVADESGCMDDRNEHYVLRLPGNRAISELVGDYMVREFSESGEELQAVPLSRATARKVHELIVMGRTPQFHGDEASGKKGCAANLNMRTSLAYNAENADHQAPLALERLRLLGIDTLGVADLKGMIEVGGERASHDALWDVDAEGVVDIAEKSGAPVVYYKGAHHTPGPRENVSETGFDNASFRAEHQSDDGQPMGALDLDYGGYVKQLREDGFSEQEIAVKTAGVILFTIAILKLADSDEAVDVIVG